MIQKFFAIIKILLLIFWSAVLVPLQVIVLFFHKGKGAYFIPQLWHRGVSAVTGLRYEVDGVPISTSQTIFVSNHLSYLDIPIIGSVLRASFVAKEDVAGWPVLGFLSTVQQTAFISRSSEHVKKVTNSLAQMLGDGKSLIIFPEGTSTDGRTVLPFKSSLFSLVKSPNGSSYAVQPFTLTLLSTDGNPLDDSNNISRDFYAWYGDMDFGPHFWKFLCCRGAKVRLTFHAVIPPQVEHDRKALSKEAWDTIHNHLNP